MINIEDIEKISKLLNVNEIKTHELISDSFNINCLKVKLEDNKKYIVKYYLSKKQSFNAIESEINNLIFLEKNNLNFFPKIKVKNKKYLIMEFIENNNKKPQLTKNDLLKAIIKIHSIKNNKYGFGFNTQIGGLKKINNFQNNWIDFFIEKRLFYIFNLINKKNLIEKDMSKRIEGLLNKIDLLIPSDPKPSLLHGDLWEGNILFDNENFVGFIDPGSFFGHNELEIAYLRWFNPKFIDSEFLEKYNNFINIDRNYLDYEPVYQLYYSLLNVYLWNKSYIKDSNTLLKKLNM